MGIADPPSGEPGRLVLRPSKIKWALILLGSAAFVLTGALMIGVGGPMTHAPFGDARLWGWIAIIFFGLGIPLSLFQLFSSRVNLVLTPDAFSYGTIWSIRTIRWADVTGFHAKVVANRCWPLKPMELVRFEYSASYVEQSTAPSWVRALAGTGGGLLPDTYGISAEELAEKMNRWKSKYVR